MSELALASRVNRIRESASLAAGARTRELKAAGHDILNLTEGEPDFDTPEHVKEAAVSALRRGETKYTSVNGSPELRAAILEAQNSRLGVGYTDAEVAAGGGAKQMIFLALMATIEAGAEVVVPAPYWVSYPDMVLANGGKPVIVECPESGAFKITASALEEAITERTRWVILNAPGNPTGAVYTREELTALAEVLMRHPHVLVLSDDIYEMIYFGEGRVTHLLDVEPRLRERVLAVNGVSKAYAMTGWRLGYATGPAALVAAMNKLQSQITSCPSSISQAAAVAALTGDQSFVDECVQVYRERRDVAVRLLNDVPELSCRVPDGAFYLFVSCAGAIGRRRPDGRVIETDEDFAMYLLDRGVAGIHGSAYGLAPYYRVSYATGVEVVKEACGRIAQACADLA